MRSRWGLFTVLLVFSAQAAAADSSLREPPGTFSHSLRDSPSLKAGKRKPGLIRTSARNTLPGGIEDSIGNAPELKPPQDPIVDKRKKPKPAAAPAAPDAPAEIRTTLKRISFEGNTVFTQDQLAELVKDYLGRPLTLGEIYEAGDVVTNHYVLAGYSLAVVTIPEQKVSDGVVVFRVLEGVIGTVTIEDNSLYSSEHIRDYLGALQPGQLYRATPLEESLQDLNALPGLQTKAVLKPGEDPGASDVVVKVQEKPYAAALSMDNFGRSNTGELRGTLALVANNLLGLADQFQAVTLQSGTGGLRYYSGAYSLKPWAWGPRIGLSYGEAKFKVGGAPVSGVSRNGRVSLDFSILNTRAHKLNFGMGASRIVSSVNLAGLPQPVTGITTYDYSATYNRFGESGEATAAVISFATNFRSNTAADCTGAGNSSCRNQALKMDLGVQHLQPLFFTGLDALLRVNASYSPEPLPDSQQFSAGGSGNVRAYRSAEVRGDTGYAASLDLRYGFALPLSARGVLRLFTDTADVGTQDSVVRATLAQDRISDYGVGFDVVWTDHFNLRFDWSLPMGDAYLPSDGTRVRDSRIYASTSLSY